MKIGESVYVFRQGFLPVWEDRRNINGGALTYRVSKHLGPEFWTRIQLFAIGEELQDFLDNPKVKSGEESQKFLLDNPELKTGEDSQDSLDHQKLKTGKFSLRTYLHSTRPKNFRSGQH